MRIRNALSVIDFASCGNALTLLHLERGKLFDRLGVDHPDGPSRYETKIEGDFGPIRRPRGQG